MKSKNLTITLNYKKKQIIEICLQSKNENLLINNISKINNLTFKILVYIIINNFL